jgi:hypothetical protein
MIIKAWDPALDTFTTKGLQNQQYSNGAASADSTYMAPAFGAFASSAADEAEMKVPGTSSDSSTLSTEWIIVIACVGGVVVVGAIIVAVLVTRRGGANDRDAGGNEPPPAIHEVPLPPSEVVAASKGGGEAEQAVDPAAATVDVESAAEQRAAAPADDEVSDGVAAAGLGAALGATGAAAAADDESSSCSSATSDGDDEADVDGATADPVDVEMGVTPGDDDESVASSSSSEAEELEARIRDLDEKLAGYRQARSEAMLKAEADEAAGGHAAKTPERAPDSSLSATQPTIEEEKKDVEESVEAGFDRYMQTSKLATLKSLYRQRTHKQLSPTVSRQFSSGAMDRADSSKRLSTSSSLTEGSVGPDASMGDTPGNDSTPV